MQIYKTGWLDRRRKTLYNFFKEKIVFNISNNLIKKRWQLMPIMVFLLFVIIAVLLIYSTLAGYSKNSKLCEQLYNMEYRLEKTRCENDQLRMENNAILNDPIYLEKLLKRANKIFDGEHVIIETR